ncbi:hypothetical protein GCM10007874_09130 [Labrys miyagiensis]|uniref:Uncharacterized protein n=1 Tax=Labrys miyagiensis TaxID=346912 RepID=A0ABQ6CBZ7_9HYPH|nr:hypothetical protein [Labrys miyagiensis]GLS17897.1 hypothetical protein GCM10007874_09130 [Labrys miyagiensis]
MNAFFGPWLDNYNSILKLNVEAQQVISLRVMKLAHGGRRSEIESQRMISEKLAALAEAQIGMLTDIATGQGLLAPGRAIAVFQRQVSANRRRLSR